ncbi:uncharacterized protein JCM10292_000854 [Rhodotorula paludigena]|uniref:uncharacterized protein n=1 Tax=Rhodotorula paludigena TaxID=86838 RepID=UPI00316EA0FE
MDVSEEPARVKDTDKITENLESCSVDWRIKSYKAFLASWTEAGDGFAYRSPPFLGHRWRLSIRNIAGKWVVVLEALEPASYHSAGSTRRGEYLWSFEDYFTIRVVLLKVSPNGRIPYTPDDLLPLANLGVSEVVSPEGQRLVALSAAASFDYTESSAREVEPVTQVTYSPLPVVSAPSPAAPIPAPLSPSPAPSVPYASSSVRDSLYPEAFDNPEECDTVFEVSLPSGKVGYVFTLKELLVKDSQHFAELLSSAERDFKLDPSVYLDVDASDRFNPAEDMWKHLRKSEYAEGAALDEKTVTLEDLSEASEGDNLCSLLGNDDVSATTSTSAHGVSSDERLYFHVTVQENDWLSYNTVLAIVYYLHFGTVSFAVSPALALAADSAAPFLPLTPKTARKGAIEQLSAPLCLAQVVADLTAAHAWELPALHELAAQHVVSQLTVESAAYELFSRAGAAYRCITNLSSSLTSAVPFLRTHFSAIKASPAWERCMALLEDGILSHAYVTRLRILEALATVKGT